MTTYNTPLDTEVTQNERNYYIRIAARDRERAKRIPGRRWDPETVKWVCPKTQAAYDAIQREFQRPEDRVEIEPPIAPPEPVPQPPADSARSSPPEWVESLTGLPNELEDIKAQAFTNAETLDRILKNQQAVLERLAAPESPPEPSEPDDAGAFSRYLRRIAAAAAGNDASFIELTQSFDIAAAPLDCVSKAHNRIEASLREFMGAADSTVNIPELIRSAERQGYWTESWIAGTLHAMNYLRNSLSHEEMRSEESVALATLYLLNLTRVWPHFASEQPPDNDYPASEALYVDGRILRATTGRRPGDVQ